MTRLAQLLEEFEQPNLFTETFLPNVRLFRAVEASPRSPILYEPGICVVAQGAKTGYLDSRPIRYDPDHYLVTSLVTPFECETHPSPEEPLLGLMIRFDTLELNALVGQMKELGELDVHPSDRAPKPIGPAPFSIEMEDAVVRLVRCLKSETDTAILGKGLLREILYRALRGSQGPSLIALSEHDSNFCRVAQALRLIQNDFRKKIDVEEMARESNMAVSAFHRAFKEVTSESPIQYLKKLRLTRAKDMIVFENEKVYLAAERVGYESPSQFSREFKRYFGKSPAEYSRGSSAPVE